MKEETQKESSGVQRILGQKHISWKDGEFFLWNIPGMILPMHTILDITHSLQQKYGQDANMLLYQVGERQTVLAIDYMKTKFGFKRDTDVINSVLQQSTLLGYGNFRLLNLDVEKGLAVFKNLNNPFAKAYLSNYGLAKEPIDYYFSGTKAGIIEAIAGEALAAFETKCIAKGDPYCLFEVRKPEDVPEEYRHQIPRVLVSPGDIRMLVEKTKKMLSLPKS
jgi:hypothetical protein